MCEQLFRIVMGVHQVVREARDPAKMLNKPCLSQADKFKVFLAPQRKLFYLRSKEIGSLGSSRCLHTLKISPVNISILPPTSPSTGRLRHHKICLQGKIFPSSVFSDSLMVGVSRKIPNPSSHFKNCLLQIGLCSRI